MWLLFGRIRPLHVNGVIFAWLSMMYWGALFYMIPRLTGLRTIWSEKLAIWTAWGWNLWFILGILSIAMGRTQGREYAEFIWPLDYSSNPPLDKQRRQHHHDRGQAAGKAAVRDNLVGFSLPALAGRRLHHR